LKTFALSKEADADLQEIYLYSAENWGETGATEYIENLFHVFELLAQRPGIARVLHNAMDLEHTPLGGPFPNQV
jgi:plasmid stabilization system protein ParE